MGAAGGGLDLGDRPGSLRRGRAGPVGGGVAKTCREDKVPVADWSCRHRGPPGPLARAQGLHEGGRASAAVVVLLRLPVLHLPCPDVGSQAGPGPEGPSEGRRARAPNGDGGESEAPDGRLQLPDQGVLRLGGEAERRRVRMPGRALRRGSARGGGLRPERAAPAKRRTEEQGFGDQHPEAHSPGRLDDHCLRPLLGPAPPRLVGHGPACHAFCLRGHTLLSRARVLPRREVVRDHQLVALRLLHLPDGGRLQLHRRGALHHPRAVLLRADVVGLRRAERRQLCAQVEEKQARRRDESVGCVRLHAATETWHRDSHPRPRLRPPRLRLHRPRLYHHGADGRKHLPHVVRREPLEQGRASSPVPVPPPHQDDPGRTLERRARDLPQLHPLAGDAHGLAGRSAHLRLPALRLGAAGQGVR
mmetsp:Transcript_32037/g.95437  ORF Transcript_32037/g.95437 Transcript_32037/m.95437 type:complete len:418 (+) Transcript_32037:63-1316(+)